MSRRHRSLGGADGPLVAPDGYRYLSSTGEPFLHVRLALTLGAVRRDRALLLISDGVR